MKKIIRLPSLSRVVAGSKATLELPLGPTYERLIFTVTAGAGLNAADIGRIGLLFNGQEKVKFKNLARLIAINSYYNRDADTITATQMQFAVHFNRAEMVDNVMRAAPGIGTNDLQTFHAEIDIASGAPADIDIKAHALVNPTRQNLGTFFNVREYPTSSSVAGDFEIDKLPRGAFYSAIHLFKEDITNVELTVNDSNGNNIKIIEATKSVLERLQRGASPVKRVPLTAEATHVDFVTEGNLLDSLPTAGLQDLRIKVTLATAGNIDVVTETMDSIVV